MLLLTHVFFQPQYLPATRSMAGNITFPHREPGSYSAGSPITHSLVDINKASSHAWNISTFPLSQRLQFWDWVVVSPAPGCHIVHTAPIMSLTSSGVLCVAKSWHYYLIEDVLAAWRLSVLKLTVEKWVSDCVGLTTQVLPGKVRSLQQEPLLRSYGHLRASLWNRPLMPLQWTQQEYQAASSTYKQLLLQ